MKNSYLALASIIALTVQVSFADSEASHSTEEIMALQESVMNLEESLVEIQSQYQDICDILENSNAEQKSSNVNLFEASSNLPVTISEKAITIHDDASIYIGDKKLLDVIKAWSANFKADSSPQNSSYSSMSECAVMAVPTAYAPASEFYAVADKVIKLETRVTQLENDIKSFTAIKSKLLTTSGGNISYLYVGGRLSAGGIDGTMLNFSQGEFGQLQARKLTLSGTDNWYIGKENGSGCSLVFVEENSTINAAGGLSISSDKGDIKMASFTSHENANQCGQVTVLAGETSASIDVNGLTKDGMVMLTPKQNIGCNYWCEVADGFFSVHVSTASSSLVFDYFIVRK